MAKSLEEKTRPGEEVSLGGESGTITRSVAVAGGHEVTVVISDDSERAPKIGHAVHAAAWSNNVIEQEEANAVTYAEVAEESKEATEKELKVAKEGAAADEADGKVTKVADSKPAGSGKLATNSTVTGSTANAKAANAK